MKTISSKTAIKISIVIACAFFLCEAILNVNRAYGTKANVKAITLSASDLVEMNNILMDEMYINAVHEQQMQGVRARYLALRDKNKVPADWVNEKTGNTVVGFRPETPEEKDKRNHPPQP